MRAASTCLSTLSAVAGAGAVAGSTAGFAGECGAGGTATNGDLNIVGQGGGAQAAFNTFSTGGIGGGSYLGGGAFGKTGGAAGVTATGYGGGGSSYGGGGYGGGGQRQERQMFDVTCSECGQAAQVPFKPNGVKPVLCRDCFRR